MKKLLLLTLLTIGQAFSAETAVYRVTFKNLWNAADHVSFPGNAHFSDIVAISHNSDFQLFSLGKKVTKGFEDLAELGRTAGILNELQEAQSMGTVDTVTTAPALFPRRDGDTITFEVEVSKEKSLISFATMIAPSPDWVVGVNDLKTLVNGEFIKSFSVDLVAIDAGTEDGDFAGNFSINNRPTTPQKDARLLNHLSGLDLPFATVLIEKL
jgi:hypothetical protein